MFRCKRSLRKFIPLPGKVKVFFWKRRTIVTTFLIGKTVFIHNGRLFEKLYVMPLMLGFKLGEFVLTKILSKTIHERVKKAKIKKKRK